MVQLAEVVRRRGLALVVQHGSTVSGATHAASDLDLAVLYGGEPPGLGEQGELIAELQECFPGRPVDLVVLDHADPLLLHRVVSRCRLLAGEPRRLAELAMLAFKRYQDHRPYLALERRYLDGVLASFQVSP